jgi:transcriptional regulator with XRE-family HTH domain
MDWQERLGEAMEARGLTGGELARRTGFTAQYINSLKSKERGARLPLDTARRLAHALGVSVEWLVQGTGPRERLSDVYPVAAPPDIDVTPVPRSGFVPLTDRYPSRVEAMALLATTVEPEVLSALRAVVPDNPDEDPGRDYWIDYARGLVKDLRRIKGDPVLAGAARGGRAPRSKS